MQSVPCLGINLDIYYHGMECKYCEQLLLLVTLTITIIYKNISLELCSSPFLSNLDDKQKRKTEKELLDNIIKIEIAA